MKRARGLLVAVGWLAVPYSAWAQCTVPAATTVASTDVPKTITNPAGCGIGTPVTSQITVSGQPTFLLDVDVVTQVTHPCPQELQIMLTSPSLKVVTLTSNSPRGLPPLDVAFPPTVCTNNLFANTTWNDAADPGGQLLYEFNANLVTDRDPAVGGTAAQLVPEEALSAFFGDNPNGVWTLTVVDQCDTNAGGTLTNWSLKISAIPTAPTTTTTSVVTAVAAANQPIPDGPGGVKSFPATVAVADGTFLVDVNVSTNLQHPSSGDVQMVLRSPSSRFATLTTRNGVGADNFNGTVWDDSANFFDGPANHPVNGGNSGVATDHPYATNSIAPALVPEDSLGTFFGENPNGDWQLVIADRVANAATGLLTQWTLDVTTGVCPPVPPTPTSTPLPPGPTLTPTITPTPTPTIPLVICNGLPANIVGSTGDDVLIGGDTDDVIHGLAGNDVIKGRRGNDMLCGGGGNDVLRGNKDDDLIKGGPGNDEVRGGGGRDVLLGGRDNDFHDGGDDDAGDENDTCIDRKGSNAFVNCENVEQ